ncbi:hypothetical protein AAVH_19535 [Aphelenchoides avenae]|nr:hypothetical protein AAVH_19535 [Aphelenchus avenae]
MARGSAPSGSRIAHSPTCLGGSRSNIVRSAGATVREVEISADGSYRCLEQPQEPKAEAIEVDDVDADEVEDAEERDRRVVVPLSTLQDMRRMTQKILLATAEGPLDADKADTSADLRGSLAELHVATKKCLAGSKPAADLQRAEQLDQKVQELEAKLKDAFDPFEVLKKMLAGFRIIGIPKKQPAPNDPADDGDQQETGGSPDAGAEQQEQQNDLSKRLKELDEHPVVVLFPPSTLTSATDSGAGDAAERAPAASRKRLILQEEFRSHVGPYVTKSKSIFGNEELDFAQIRRFKCTIPYQITDVDRWTINPSQAGQLPGRRSADDSHENKILKLLLQAGRQPTDEQNVGA